MMKGKTALLVTLMALALGLASCAGETQGHSQAEPITPNSESASLPPQSQAKLVRLPSQAVENFLTQHPIDYPDPFSQFYPQERIVPGLLRYVGNSLYLESAEETPFVGKENPVQTPEGVINKLYRYTLETKEKQAIGILLDGVQSSDFLLTQATYYYYPMRDETLYVCALDLKSGETATLLELPQGSIYVRSGILQNGCAVFLVRFSENETAQQRIYKIKTDRTVEIIYDSIKDGSGLAEFSTMTVYGDFIYALRQLPVNGALKTSVVQMNSAGEFVREIDLPNLEAYVNPDYFADKMYVVGDYIFVKWYYCEELPYFNAYLLKEDKAEAVPYAYNAPCYLLNDQFINGRYLIFSTFPDNMDYTANTFTSTLMLLDTATNAFIGVKIPLDESYTPMQMVVNENGDILISLMRSEQSTTWTVSSIPFYAIETLLP